MPIRQALALVVTTALAAAAVVGAGGAALAADGGGRRPAPPQVPEDFTWTGRYVVPDLDLEVPFTWHGDGGNFQMTAGREGDPIHFTNLVYDGRLYTLTYAFPDIPRHPCSDVGPFTLDDLNQGLAKARFVGKEVLDDATPRKVHHFRAGVVWEPGPDLIAPIPGVPIRIPVMAGDIYVDRSDPTTFRKVLQFGLQNLYDPELDEWIVIDKTRRAAGDVTLPEECAAATAAATTPTTTAG